MACLSLRELANRLSGLPLLCMDNLLARTMSYWVEIIALENDTKETVAATTESGSILFVDYMLSFIYLAYQMMALLYETAPGFEDTWIECLGDLGRYRMAVEDKDIRDREMWAGVAHTWYTKVAANAPTVPRIYHNLASPKSQRWCQSINNELWRTIRRVERKVHSLPNR
jgi:hypothetical protein